MSFFHILIPITIGALIGYCTNYIAIKMLFRPKKAIMIGKWTLPFTPGVIPKNKARLAKAAGDAVGNNLVTGEDIKEILCSDELKNHVVSSISDIIFSDDMKLSNIAEELSGKNCDAVSMRAAVILSEKIKNGAASVDFASIIGEVASKAVSEKFSGTMISMFLNESTINMITEPIGEVLVSYIEENGSEVIYPVVKEKLDEMGTKSLPELMEGFEFERIDLEEITGRLYLKIMQKHASDITSFIDIRQIVEEKINAMSTDDLENLVMSVMKNELQMVINLGALIGAVIGVLNILFL